MKTRFLLLTLPFFMCLNVSCDNSEDEEIEEIEGIEEMTQGTFVDLGLSVKWATCNVGANSPLEYGDYFAWGETEPNYEPCYAQENPQSHWKSGKSGGYDWISYKYRTGGLAYRDGGFTKYCDDSYFGDNGYSDTRTVLDLEDDAAHVNWGGAWRMPTYEELEELYNNCTLTWTKINGIYGCKVQSKKSGYTDRWIFLPAAGAYYDSELDFVRSYGAYWSSSLEIGDQSSFAYILDFSSDEMDCYPNNRRYGHTVRPVLQADEYIPVSGISLNYETLSLNIDENTTLIATVTPSDATFNGVNWTSNNTAVATVDDNGYVTAVGEGTATIAASSSEGNSSTGCKVTVVFIPQYVDLGLSVKWATCNVGAIRPEEYGDYFAWGAAEPFYEPGYAQENPQSHWKSGKSDGYNLLNAPYETANTTDWFSTRWTKYLGSTTSSYKDPSATNADAMKTVLDPEDDAAHVNWGGNWRMPTIDEFEELCNEDNCTWTWYESGNSEFRGIAGCKVTSKKSGYTDASIFLPAAGIRYDTNIGDIGNYAIYWLSSLSDTISPQGAFEFSFYMGHHGANICTRNDGNSVRPVYP